MAQLIDQAQESGGLPSDVGPLGDPLAYLAHDHATQRALADLLEGVADGLPDGADRRAAALGMTRSGYIAHLVRGDQLKQNRASRKRR